MEEDKSCQATAVSWFMAPVGQATSVFNVHFRGGAEAPAWGEGWGGAQCNIKVQKIGAFVFSRGRVMDLAFNLDD